MLDKHGPNVVFSRHTDPDEVIEFIERNFDLSGRTDELMDAPLPQARRALEATPDLPGQVA
jgi:hypothetical protein